MRHYDCKNYINLDCEKGMCAIGKMIVPIDGPGSEACPAFVQAEKCGNCAHFTNPDSMGIGTCTGFDVENWAFASCGALTCENYKAK